jgi:hypothetical protein
MKVEQQQQSAFAVMEKDDCFVLFRHNHNFCLLPLARSLGIYLSVNYFNQPAKIN